MMAIKYMKAVFDSNRTKGNERLILLALADATTQAGWTWIGYATIADMANASQPTVAKCLYALHDRGDITIYRRKSTKGNNNLSNLYQLTAYGASAEPPADLIGSIEPLPRPISKAKPQRKIADALNPALEGGFLSGVKKGSKPGFRRGSKPRLRRVLNPALVYPLLIPQYYPSLILDSIAPNSANAQSGADKEQPQPIEENAPAAPPPLPLTPSSAAPLPPTPKKTRAKKPTVPAEIINPMKDAIAAAFGWKWETMTGAEKGMIQNAAKQLCEASRKPEDVARIYAYLKAQGWKGSFTPMALTTHATAALNGKAAPPPSKPAPTHPAQPARKPVDLIKVVDGKMVRIKGEDRTA